jgi:hypothetical protein
MGFLNEVRPLALVSILQEPRRHSFSQRRIRNDEFVSRFQVTLILPGASKGLFFFGA